MAARPQLAQRTARAIAMTPDEVDAFLVVERTVRVASVNAAGRPHVVPMWFVWDGSGLWLNSLVNSKRWRDFQRNAWVAAVVDAGSDYAELRGVEITGRVEVASEVPRTAVSVAGLAHVERSYARKYRDTDLFVADGRHAWLRIVPDSVVSWDFRKSRRLRTTGDRNAQ
jgi:nitroimidazol reductase NimA-like FMN-containing flavoprotein (pyridoxamine 5'-phosphate oxidase superfamily)